MEKTNKNTALFIIFNKKVVKNLCFYWFLWKKPIKTQVLSIFWKWKLGFRLWGIFLNISIVQSPLPGQVHSTYHIECIAAAAEALGALPFTPLNAEAAVEARVWVGNAFIGNAPMKPELQWREKKGNGPFGLAVFEFVSTTISCTYTRTHTSTP